MRNDSLLEVAAVSRAGRVVTAERTAASGFMPPLHAHPADEVVHVVEGSLTLFAGPEAVTLGPGETFVVAEGVAHTLRVESRQARMVFTTFAGSAGRYEDFLRATGPVTLGPSGSAVWAGVEDARTVGAVAAAANVSVYGPPGMLPAGAETAPRAA
jgi:mannose-6-phosphate isomerase-like protein (cupin superfamily)